MASSYQPNDAENSDDGIVAEINITPLTDVFLVLLIIFMVITPMVQKGIDIKLPETSTDTEATPVGLIVLTLKKDLTVEVNKAPFEFDLVKDELRRIYATRQDKTAFIRADENFLTVKLSNSLTLLREQE